MDKLSLNQYDFIYNVRQEVFLLAHIARTVYRFAVTKFVK